MNLTTLNSYLQGQISGGNLTLDATDANLGTELQGFLAKSPLTKIVIATSGGTGVTLSGETLTIDGTSTESWPIQGMNKVDVSVAKVTLTLNGNTTTTVDGNVTGSLAIGSTAAAVTLTSSSTKVGEWKLVPSATVSNVSSVELMALPAFGPLPFPLPDNVTFWDLKQNLDATNFEIDYYPQTESDFSYFCTLAAPGANWDIVPNIFELKGLKFQVYYYGTALNLTVLADFTIGSVGVTLGIKANATENWEVFIRPTTGTTFPGLADLASLIGGSSMEGDLNSGMSDLAFGIPSFDAAISQINMGFNWKTFSLNFLKVQSVLTVAGYLYNASFQYPELEIKASLDASTPIKIADMFSALGVPEETIPSDIEITVIDLDANVSKSIYSMGIEVDAGSSWVIGPITMESLFFNVQYANKEATGGITANFDVSDTPLYLSAGYGGTAQGWFFEGGSSDDTGLKIGDAISDLTTKFGLTVPAAIANMELDSLQFSYETGTGDFNFGFDCSLEIQDIPIKVTPSVKIINTGTKQAPVYSDTYAGVLDVSTLEFTLVFNKTGADDVFIASYSHTADQEAFSIYKLVAWFSTDLAKIIPTSLEVDLKDVIFAYSKSSGGTPTKKWTLGMDIGATFNLSDIPLVGDVLPEDETVGFENLKIQYSNNAFTKDEVSTINDLLSAYAPDAQGLPAEGFPSGLNATAKMKFGSATTSLNLDMSGNSSDGPQTTPAPNAVAATSAPAYSSGTWFTLQKSIGPIYFKRVGVDYSDGTLYFLLDASFSVAGLTLSLQGAGFGSPLDKFEPKFRLSGIGIEYKSPGLEIGGGLLIVDPLPDDIAFQFDGDVIIKVSQLSIAAIGSYAQFKTGEPSLFVFGNVGLPIGPIPAFFITGLSAGFGYNRDVLIPSFDNVTDFPLIAISNNEPGMPTDMESVLAIMEGQQAGPSGTKNVWIAPKLGEYWLAFGLQFNTYEIVQSNAMLVAKFGKEFELALIGISKMQLPQFGDNPYVYVELQLLADWKPNDGFFGLSAVLSKTSYVIDKNCHLTGGFAFFLWYSGEYSGQFVLTIGGYHPDFTVPSYYPQIPRVGVNWAISDKIALTGDAYFALTPGSVMAGGGLSINFHDGNLKAWFTAQANMLITFKPFYFTVGISVSVGVSYKLDLLFTTTTIKVELGASLDLWGPPVGGKVHVDFYIIAFTIDFGPSKGSSNNTPLEWSEFKDLLPKDNENTVSINSGMSRQLDSGTWVVRADEFEFTTNSVIPAKTLKYNDSTTVNASDYAFDIRPMNETSVDANQNLTITKKGENSPIDASAWTLEPVHKNMPATLWGAPLKQGGEFLLNPTTPSNDTISDAPVGISAKAPDPTIGYSPGPVEISKLEYEPIRPDGTLPVVVGEATSKLYEPTPSTTSVASIAGIMGSSQVANRNAIFSAIHTATGFAGSNGTLNNLVTNINSEYTDTPMEVTV